MARGTLAERRGLWQTAWGVAVAVILVALGWWGAARSSARPSLLWLVPIGLALVMALYFVFAPVFDWPPFRPPSNETRMAFPHSPSDSTSQPGIAEALQVGQVDTPELAEALGASTGMTSAGRPRPNMRRFFEHQAMIRPKAEISEAQPLSVLAWHSTPGQLDERYQSSQLVQVGSQRLNLWVAPPTGAAPGGRWRWGVIGEPGGGRSGDTEDEVKAAAEAWYAEQQRRR